MGIPTPAPDGCPMPLALEAIPVLSDNYVLLLSRGHEAVLVDPAVAEPLINTLEQRGLSLVAVLHTHHHHDHIGGTPGLLRRWPGAQVVAAAADLERIPLVTRPVVDGDRLTLLGESVVVLEVPGHTRAHLAYLLPERGEVFCGDTLFVGGCGRLFEGTPAQMLDALRRLTALPPATRLWCAHEYAVSNLRWAVQQVPQGDPLHAALLQRLLQVEDLRRRGLPTIPTTVAQERATNLFVRCGTAAELALLRSHKDHWRG
jgi:hydroxyacylglutathione hydrolase